MSEAAVATKKPRSYQKKKLRNGRPHAIEWNAKTKKDILGLARIQCTQTEMAAFFGVTPMTFGSFLKRHEEARDIIEEGRGKGNISLRRLQWKQAQKSTTMAIWLGKQYLGQTDKMEETVNANHEHSVSVIQEAALELDAGLDLLASRLEAGGGGRKTSEGAGGLH